MSEGIQLGMKRKCFEYVGVSDHKTLKNIKRKEQNGRHEMG